MRPTYVGAEDADIEIIFANHDLGDDRSAGFQGAARSILTARMFVPHPGAQEVRIQTRSPSLTAV